MLESHGGAGGGAGGARQAVGAGAVGVHGWLLALQTAWVGQLLAFHSNWLVLAWTWGLNSMVLMPTRVVVTCDPLTSVSLRIFTQVVDLGGASVISQDPGRALWFPTNRRVTLRNGTLAVAGGAVVPDGADVTLSGVVVVGSEAHGVTVLRGGRARVGGQSQILACQRAGLANVGGGYLEVTEHSCASGNAVGLLVHGVHGALGNTVIDRAFFLDNAACGIAVDDLPAHAHAHASGGSAAPGPVALYATSPFCARNGVGLRVRGCVAAKVVRGVFVSQAGSGVEVEDEVRGDVGGGGEGGLAVGSEKEMRDGCVGWSLSALTNMPMVVSHSHRHMLSNQKHPPQPCRYLILHISFSSPRRATWTSTPWPCGGVARTASTSRTPPPPIPAQAHAL